MTHLQNFDRDVLHHSFVSPLSVGGQSSGLNPGVTALSEDYTSFNVDDVASINNATVRSNGLLMVGPNETFGCAYRFRSYCSTNDVGITCQSFVGIYDTTGSPIVRFPIRLGLAGQTTQVDEIVNFVPYGVIGAFDLSLMNLCFGVSFENQSGANVIAAGVRAFGFVQRLVKSPPAVSAVMR